MTPDARSAQLIASSSEGVARNFETVSLDRVLSPVKGGQRSSPGARIGRRTKKLKAPVVAAMPEALRKPFRAVLRIAAEGRQLLSMADRADNGGPAIFFEVTQSDPPTAAELKLRDATLAPSYRETVPLVIEALRLALAEAIRASEAPKKGPGARKLEEAGLDQLLAECVLEGRLVPEAVDARIQWMTHGLRRRTAAADTLKEGILIFDAAAQRLAQVSDKRYTFAYDPETDRVRALVIAFASSLHR